ncbi:MAG: M28 family peptidase [Streptosporangiales bacterium]|nr:M28 family peptidase [Streptosporangiales bacterium]
MSSYTGLVGTSGAARRVAYSVDKLRSWGLHPQVSSYGVYASVPKSIEVTMTEPTRRELSVKESPHPWHEGFENVVVGYNAYSPPGDVTGELVYANYGLPEDYEKLEELGVDVKDKIVIVRYGQSFRGVKSKVAEEHGARGVIIYSDPEDDGYVQGKVYPDGPWRPANSIQRGSIQYIFNYPGDPLTPGGPATPGTPRIDPSEADNLPRVPTTPISYGQAKYLLRALAGPKAPEEWQGGLKFDYHVGPGPSEANLDLDIDYRQLPVHNVITTIPGTEHPEQKVVVGGHLDSWTYGAADNNSGWISVLGIARGLGALLEDGWRPDRTIVLAGWDGEEYGLFGSTEWVEQLEAELGRGAVAYVNMDGTGGKNFSTSAVPALDDLITAVTKAVEDPDHGTVYGNWTQGDAEPEVGRLGSGSDYTPFLDHVGIPSTDVGFSTDGGEYHSAYDDTYQMEHFLDPGYLHHTAASEVSGLLALRLANADTLPLVYSDYAAQVRGYLTDLDELQRERYGERKVDLGDAQRAARKWQRAAKALEDAASAATSASRGDRPSEAEFAGINRALMAQERDLTQRVGLPQRPWYKHMIYAPGLYTGYAVQFLPALETAIEDGDFVTAREYRDLLVDSLRRAARDAGR